jgi:ABC-type nitrate/sulfonate/bicarbonate transport system substrate-binding protein
MIVAACGSDEADSSPDTEAPAPTEAPDEDEASASSDAPAEGEQEMADLGSATIAWTSQTQPTFVNRDFGLFERASDFGVTYTEDNNKVFDSHSIAVQTVLSGDADVVGGSFVATMLVNQAGQDFRSFCPFIKNDDFVLVTREPVDGLSALFDDELSVAIDSPGGAGDIILNSMLQAAGETRTVQDLPGAQIIESSGLRTTTFAAGEVDASLVHLTQLQDEILPVVPDAYIVSRMWEDVPVFLKNTLSAPTEWLDENQELAAGLCAAIIQGSRELVADEEAFNAAVEKYVDEPPMAELPVIFPLITDQFWPLETGITEEEVQTMAEASIAAGVLEEIPAYEDVVDPRPFERALEMVGS